VQRNTAQLHTNFQPLVCLEPDAVQQHGAGTAAGYVVKMCQDAVVSVISAAVAPR
jgi:hypothetical protein